MSFVPPPRVYYDKVIPTTYNGVDYRSRLEARWACAFDLCGIEYEYEPIDLVQWTPDFYVKIPCHHSCCNGKWGKGYHDFYAEVKPYRHFNEWDDHLAAKVNYGIVYPNNDLRNFEDGYSLGVCATLLLGCSPQVSHITAMGHGAGGGIFEFEHFFDIDAQTWRKAGNAVRTNYYRNGAKK